ncbi:ferredoxin [Micromonospora fluostatini]|uniref:ferredoxin n=1 Tax=Micromonospora sp. JCM 30529 TaxID=3421643 RepID=UPI003D167137
MSPADGDLAHRTVTGTTSRVTVDRDACCGAGNCVRTAPEVFDQDDADGLVLLRRAEPPPGSVDAVHRAVELCPSGAIRVT